MDLRKFRSRFRLALALYVSFLSMPNLAFCQTAAQPPDREREVEELLRKLQSLDPDYKDRRASDHKMRNSLDRKIEKFHVKNGDLSHAIVGLRHLGVNLCWERVLEKQQWYVDQEGVAVFATDHLFPIDLKDASLREVLDQICKLDERYAWTHYPKYGLIVLAPQHNSRLQFRLRAVKEKGNPTEILQRIDDSQQGPPLANILIRGDNNLPDVNLDVPSGTAMELLNQMAAQHPGITWSFGGRVTFSYVLGNNADAVAIEFPEVAKGEPTNQVWRYDITDTRINDVLTVIAQKRPRNK